LHYIGIAIIALGYFILPHPVYGNVFVIQNSIKPLIEP